MADFLFGLNTSTIQPISLMDKIRIAGEAGYDAIELWINDVEKYVESGGKLADVSKALDDRRLLRPSMISLRDWCVEDEAKFQAACEQAQRRLEMAYRLGVRRIVAGPPGGKIARSAAIDRYGKILELSLEFRVPASLEFLGFVEGINTIEEAWAICGGVGRAEGTITPDIWHMFRGGSKWETLDDIPGEHISCFHWNDAPAEPEQTKQTDADRVHPGLGILNLKRVADQLRAKGWRETLSLELFNRSYWAEDPLEVARRGLEMMKRSIA